MHAWNSERTYRNVKYNTLFVITLFFLVISRFYIVDYFLHIVLYKFKLHLSKIINFYEQQLRQSKRVQITKNVFNGS